MYMVVASKFLLNGDIMPKVSIVIPIHNYADYISDCLDSILRQTYKDIEIIVVDDCSTDNSIKIIKSYANKGVKLIQNTENKGPHRTRHTGASASTGDYIMFLDADDQLLVDDFIEIHVDTFDVFDDVDLVYCDYVDYIDNKPVEYVTRMEWEHIYKCCSAAPWSMFKRKCFEDVSHTFNFPIEVAGEDWDFLICLAENGCKAYHINSFMIFRRLHGKNISYNYKDPIHIPYIISRHPNCYSLEEFKSAIQFIQKERPQYWMQEWIKPVTSKEKMVD